MNVLAVALLAMSAGWDLSYFPHESRDAAMLACYRHVDPFTGRAFASAQPIESRSRMSLWAAVPAADKQSPAFVAMRRADAAGLLSPSAVVRVYRDSVGIRLVPGSPDDESLFDLSRRAFYGWPVE